MTGEIKPALTAEEWAGGTILDSNRAHQARFGPDTHNRCVWISGTPVERVPALMAVCNAALPDDSTYKITRAWIDNLTIARNIIRADAVLHCMNGDPRGVHPCEECKAACEEFCDKLDGMIAAIAALLSPQTLAPLDSDPDLTPRAF